MLAIPKPQQSAEKAHAYSVPWTGRLNTRTKDLAALVILIERDARNPEADCEWPKVYTGNTGPLAEAVNTVTPVVQKCSPHCTRTGMLPVRVCLQPQSGRNSAGFHRASSTTVSVRAGLVVTQTSSSPTLGSSWKERTSWPS